MNIGHAEGQASPRWGCLSWRTGAVAGLSLGAAAIHLIVTPEHFQEWWGYGLFFLALAGAQASYAVGLFAPRLCRAAWYFVLGALLNAGVIGLYVVTRTAGIPLVGPEAGEVESVGLIDVVSKVFEAAIVLLTVALVFQHLRQRPGQHPAL